MISGSIPGGRGHLYHMDVFGYHKSMRCFPLPVMLALLLATISGCAIFRTSHDQAHSMAAKAGFHETQYQTELFDLMGYSRTQSGSAHLVVYIEGDGVAWRTRHQPSTDPSPTKPLGLSLAILDPSPSVAYIARPGQFTGGVRARNCGIPLWTSHRFSEAVVDVVNQAINIAKHAAKAQRVHLVGYSGGGAIALLAASGRDDIASIRTVSGNLDHEAWTMHHRVTPLFGSLNPATHATRACAIRQTHYVGGADSNTTEDMMRSYREKACVKADIQVIPGNTHSDGWSEIWPELCRTFYSAK